MCEEAYGCALGGGSPVGSNDECGAFEECGNRPPRSVRCSGEVCECSVDGQVVGECPAAGVCEQLEELFDLGAAAASVAKCCGFENWGEPARPGG